MIAGASGERDHGERRVLVAGRGKCVSADYVDVRNVVGPAEGIQNAVARVGAHARRADLMDRTAQCKLSIRAF